MCEIVSTHMLQYKKKTLEKTRHLIMVNAKNI